MPFYRVCKLQPDFNYNISLIMDLLLRTSNHVHTDHLVASPISTQAQHNRGSEASVD